MSQLGTIVDPHTVRFERLLPGPIERVWDYLTKPDCLATWLAEGEIPSRVGAPVELRFDVDEGPERKTAVIRGVVTQCEPPHVLAYTWADWSDPPDPCANSEVIFELEPQGENVLLVLTHRRLPTAFIASVCAGWHAYLGVMLSRLCEEQPEPFLAVFRRLLPDYEKHAASKLQSGTASN